MMKRRLASLGLIMLLALAACTQPAAPLSTTTPPPPQTQLPSPTSTPAPSTETPAPAKIPLGASPVVPVTGILGEHSIMEGESLSCIGRAYGVLPKAIADANGMALTDILFVSQVLKIPDVRWDSIPAGRVCVEQFNSPYAGRVATYSPFELLHMFTPTAVPPTPTVPAPKAPTPTFPSRPFTPTP